MNHKEFRVLEFNFKDTPETRILRDAFPEYDVIERGNRILVIKRNQRKSLAFGKR